MTLEDTRNIARSIAAATASNAAGVALDPAAIELANAYGPYTHGSWVGRAATIGNEEALAGRGAFMAGLIRSAILERFSMDEIRSMTLVDVGCYDGWLICQLEDLPFARMIGIEPRTKNLDKGRMIRQLLGIETRCEFRQGSIETLQETLGGVTADVVICAGLFHHLSSTADGVARLHEVCDKFLFLETICFPTSLEDDRLRDALELKDLPYFFGSQKFGVTGHKLESNYYDGSATKMSVVSLPSVEALKMFLEVQGFDEIQVVANPAEYAKAVGGGWRSFSAVCMTATKRGTPLDVADWVGDYESGLVLTLLPEPVAQALYQRFCLGEASTALFDLARFASDLITADGPTREASRESLRAMVRDRYAVEIFKNLQYAPADKTALEHGKCLLADGRHAEAESVFFRITRHLNADWRAIYRAFALLSWSFRERGEAAEAHRYRELCLLANPYFPVDLLDSSRAAFKPLTFESPTGAHEDTA